MISAFRRRRDVTRRIVLGALLMVGGVTVAIAQQQAPRPPLPDLMKVKDNLYVITSSTPGPDFTGGNTGVLVTDAGVVVVDTSWPTTAPTSSRRSGRSPTSP